MICFDTMPIIWGVQGVAKPGQDGMVMRTKRYIDHLREEKKRIMIPAPALTEYLLGFDASDQKEQLRELEKNFVVAAYDIPAAEVGAELLSDKEVLRKLKETKDYDKVRVRVDAQIVAIAIVNKAEKIISHDPLVVKLAQGRIPVEPVPIIQTQLDFALP